MSNPFEARAGEKDPFPSFEATMKQEEEDETETKLNWSIDTVAELKPLTFSPLPEQKTSEAKTTPTTDRSATFFEDEKQYRILRTPATIIHQDLLQKGQQRPILNPPAPSTSFTTRHKTVQWNQLHRRCVDTIEYCEARIRERQEKLKRLPIPAHKLKHKGASQKPWTSATTNKTKATPTHEMTTPETKGGGWGDLSPIPRPISEINHETASPRLSTSFSASFSPLNCSPSTPVNGAKSSHNKENATGNTDIQTPQPSVLQADSTPVSLHSLSLLEPSPVTLVKPSTRKAIDQQSIAARQQSFVAAIEQASWSSDSEVDRRSLTRPTLKSENSIASIYKEAKALGIVEPTAQWNYVQLMAKHTKTNPHLH